MVANHKMLNCEQVWREISNYLDEDADADTSLHAEVEDHCKSCARCASVLAGMQNVVKLYGDERMLEVPSGFGVRLEKRLQKSAAQVRPAQQQWWSSWSAWMIPAAALLLIAGGIALTNSLTFRHFVRSYHAQPANNIPPDLVVVVSDGSKLFHVPGCKYIHDINSERTMTAKEATREGYVPCTRCLRQYLKTGLWLPDDDDHVPNSGAGVQDGEVSAAMAH